MLSHAKNCRKRQRENLCRSVGSSALRCVVRVCAVDALFMGLRHASAQSINFSSGKGGLE